MNNLEIYKDVINTFYSSKENFIKEFSELHIKDKLKLLFENPNVLKFFLEKKHYIIDFDKFKEHHRKIDMFICIDRRSELSLDYILDLPDCIFHEDEDEYQRVDYSLNEMMKSFTVYEKVEYILKEPTMFSKILLDMLNQNIYSFLYDW